MKKNAGFTLIELMIAMLLALFVVGVTISIYVLTIKGSSDTVKSARLNHDLESAMTLMVNDIRRAGYWGGAVVGSNPVDNPFMSGTKALQVPNASCILYTYDADGGNDVDADEYYGFKLDGTTIKMRLDGTTTANCADGTWEEMIDSNEIAINNLTFGLNPASVAVGTLVVEQREITIDIDGRLVDDNAVTKTLSSKVIVRNNNIYTAP